MMRIALYIIGSIFVVIGTIEVIEWLPKEDIGDLLFGVMFCSFAAWCLMIKVIDIISNQTARIGLIPCGWAGCYLPSAEKKFDYACPKCGKEYEAYYGSKFGGMGRTWRQVS